MPRTSECDLFGNRAFVGVISKGHIGSGWALNQIRLVSKGQRDTHKGKTAVRHRGGNWSNLAISQGMPRIAGSHQKLEEVRRDPPLEPSESSWSCQPFGFQSEELKK